MVYILLPSIWFWDILTQCLGLCFCHPVAFGPWLGEILICCVLVIGFLHYKKLFEIHQAKHKEVVMKKNILSAIAVLSLVAGLTSTVAFAEDTKAPAASHEEHHPDAAAKPAKDEGNGMMMGNHEMMMGKMDMESMHKMMGDCMKMGKDGKMCQHETMQACKQNMKQKDCMGMMKKSMKMGK